LRTVLVRIDEGETITKLDEREVVILLERPDLTITWSRYRPNVPGPGLHVHREHVDAFYVLEGVLSFPVGPDAERVSLPPGGFAAVPPNVVHTFVNDGSVEARWLNFHAPEKGFGQYLRDARDGNPARFDTFDPPADGGLPAGDVIVAREIPDSGIGVPPDLWVVEGDEERADAYNVRIDERRFVSVRAPAR
jgi:mannose-6-phosphate isomerase-like protein (cupin superfamily)